MEACTITPRNTRIAVFYDGSYFCNVSDYYRLSHSRAAHLCHHGLHQFIKNKVEQLENAAPNTCNIVDAHYFRGRFPAADSVKHTARLLRDRIHDEALMEANITTHYLPLQHKAGKDDGFVEKGIDVWFALEAFELTMLKKYDVVVLITGDADHLPLMHKLNALNSRVMLLYWNIDLPSLSDVKGAFTSKAIVKAATYSINMFEEINKGKGKPVIEQMFTIGGADLIEQKLTNKKKEKKKNAEVKPTGNGVPLNVEMRKQILKVSKAIENSKAKNAGYAIDLEKIQLQAGGKIVIQQQKAKKAPDEKVKLWSAVNSLTTKTQRIDTQPAEAISIDVKSNEVIQETHSIITGNKEQNTVVSQAPVNDANSFVNNTSLCIYKAACTALIHIPTADAVAIKAALPAKKRLKYLTGRQKGVITWIDYHRGIGKVDISSDYPSITFYCNANNIHKFKALKKNKLVEFDLKKSQNGTFAVNLRSAAA